MRMLAAVLCAAGAMALMWYAFKGLYWICRDRQREAHEQRHHEDNDMFQGGTM